MYQAMRFYKRASTTGTEESSVIPSSRNSVSVRRCFIIVTSFECPSTRIFFLQILGWNVPTISSPDLLLTTLRSETFAGRNFHDFTLFGPLLSESFFREILQMPDPPKYLKLGPLQKSFPAKVSDLKVSVFLAFL